MIDSKALSTRFLIDLKNRRWANPRNVGAGVSLIFDWHKTMSRSGFPPDLVPDFWREPHEEWKDSWR